MPVINTNINALAAQSSLGMANAKQATAMQRLSSGLRINSAADDAAGLSIANRMTSQINGYAVAIRNSNDGISMAQTADGAMGQITTMLQRIRDLAVQSSTGTLSAADRTSSQNEVDQLKTAIQDIATKTNINGINLLDGSAGNVQLQTGTNAGDTMKMSFDSMQTKDIGLGSRASLASVQGVSTVNGAFSDGTITLNGVSVGASLSTDDSLSYADKSSSAIAKVAAINAVSAQSGVFATVGSTVVSGSTMAANANTAGQKATLNINGVETATIQLSGNNEIDRSSIASAINAISAQTGVVATNTHDDNQGISLLAADGRNISLANSNTAANTTATLTNLGLGGIGASTHPINYVGSYELNTKDGTSITVGTTVANAQSAQKLSGLGMGTFKPDTAQLQTGVRAAATVAPTSTSTGGLLGNTLVINGVGIQAANAMDDTASYDNGVGSLKANSAIAIAAAINKSSTQTGVTATAAANVISGTGYTAEAAGSAITAVTLNGVSISANFGAGTTRDNVVNTLNQYSGQTGVTATAYGNGIQLAAADGRNITIDYSGGTGVAATDAAALGLTGVAMTQGTPTTYYSSVNLSSNAAFTVAAGSEGEQANFKALGFSQGTFGGSNNSVKISQVDISTVQGATDAIKAVDAAISTVSANQSRAGAYENRLNYIVNNLTQSNQNITASRSRIQDADYGTETTNLAKAQIVQQAATAMLAQANQSQQTVLSLLK